MKRQKTVHQILQRKLMTVQYSNLGAFGSSGIVSSSCSSIDIRRFTPIYHRFGWFDGV